MFISSLYVYLLYAMYCIQCMYCMQCIIHYEDIHVYFEFVRVCVFIAVHATNECDSLMK